ncbi:hypothetical protein V8C43DRAFT_143556 [Trichoderma afarasin]
MQAGGPAIIASSSLFLGCVYRVVLGSSSRYSYQSPDPNRAVLREGVRAGGVYGAFTPRFSLSLSSTKVYSLLVVVFASCFLFFFHS